MRGTEEYLTIAILGLTREAPGEGGDESIGFPPAWAEGKESRDTREAQTTGAGREMDVGRRRRDEPCPGVSTQKKSDSPELPTALSNCRLERVQLR